MATVIHGGASTDQLNAREGKSQVYGLSGNDTIISDSKSDVLLIGGSGNDSMIMFGGNGTLSGGKGSDTFELTYSADKPVSAVIEDFDPSTDKIVVNHDGASAPQLTSEVNGSDIVWTDISGNFKLTLKGVRDNDYFDGDAPEQVWDVLELTNAEREAKNLSALTLSEGLMTGASIRANDITELGVIGKLDNHSRPDGSDFSTVLKGKYNDASENLNAGASTAVEVMVDWIGSAAHYANILKPNSKKLGVGYNYYDEDASNHRYYWTQMFADSLKSPETVSVANVSLEVNAVSKAVTDTDYANSLANDDYGVSIAALGGDDTITNSGVGVSISGGKGNDSIINNGDDVTFAYSAGDGNDTIHGFRADSTLSISDDEYTPATVGKDIVIAVSTDSISLVDAATLETVNIAGTRSKLFIGTEGDDSFKNTLDSATIEARGGNDSILNYDSHVKIIDGMISTYGQVGVGGNNVLIDSGDGYDTIYNYSMNVSINSGAGDDSIDNNGYNVSINTGDGDDYIYNRGNYASIVGGAGNDTIENYWGDDSTIAGGKGDDLISLGYSWMENVIEYKAGDGNDTIIGLDEDSTLQIGGGTGTYSTAKSSNGDDIIVTVGKGKIILEDAQRLTTLNINVPPPTVESSDEFILLSEDDDTLNNTIDKAAIYAFAGNDYISNVADNVLIDGGRGTDSIYNAEGKNVSISGGEYIENSGSNVTIDGYEYASITNKGDNVTISGGEYIENSGSNVTITGSYDGNDAIWNEGSDVKIQGSSRKDSINNRGDNVTIADGEGNDTTWNEGSNVTILGCAGNDQISLSSDAKDNLIIYGASTYNGNDTIWGMNASSSLQIYNGNDTIWAVNAISSLQIDDDIGEYSTTKSGDDIIVNANGSLIRLVNAATLSTVNIKGKLTKSSGKGRLITITEDDYYTNYDENNVTIAGSKGDDDITNHGSNVSINGDVGDDDITNHGSNVSINGDAGDDDITNHYGSNVTISGGTGNDSIANHEDNVTISGGDGNDSIENYGSDVTISGGDGNDSIENDNDNVTISGGRDNDFISLETFANNNLIEYALGDGRDTIVGFNETATLRITDGEYTAETVDNDIIVHVGTGSIRLMNAAGLSNPNIEGTLGESIAEQNLNVILKDNHSYSNTVEGATIQASSGNYSIDNTGSNVLIESNAGKDTITSKGSNVTIATGAGNDSIRNTAGDNVLIFAEAGNDTVNVSGVNVSINGGAGNDRISLSSTAENNFIQYAAGDGSDTISGFNETATLRIPDGEYTAETINNDVIIHIGTDSITLLDAANLSAVNIKQRKLLPYTDDEEDINNWSSDVIINAGNGNNDINNWGSDVIINAGNGNNDITSWGSNVTINAGNGNNDINNRGSDVIINAGADDDYVISFGSKSSIAVGAGDDYIDNTGSNVLINLGEGDDYIENGVPGLIIINDEIITDVADGGDFVTILGGAGNDFIENRGSNVSIDAGTGDDRISLWSSSRNNVIQYNIGDGNDTIWGLNSTDKLRIGDGKGTYSSTVLGDDVILTVGENKITLKNFRERPEHVILGESGTSGGTSKGESDSNDKSGDDKSSDSNDNNPGTDKPSTDKPSTDKPSTDKPSTDKPSTDKPSTDKPSTDKPSTNNQSNNIGGNISSGGNISTGNISSGNIGGVNTSGNISASGNINTGGSINTSGNSDAGGYRGGNSVTTFSSPFDTLRTTTPVANQHVYAGGNQVITDYQAGEKIIFGAAYTGALFDDANNFLVGSSTGALAVTNATDKVIDLLDAAGNDFLKAYAASTAGIIDGRGLAGFEVIKGSAGADVIFAGDNGSQLWGGVDVASDTLIGGNGMDIFVGGKNQGADIFVNAAANDVVFLSDSTLEDIVATAGNDNAVAIAFNTGNVVMVGSSEPLSAAFLLADGSAYRYNHVTKSWQDA